jgi:hypothetical protein
VCRSAGEQDCSRDGGRRRENRVLECAEPEHAHSCLPGVEAGRLERLPVDDEAPTDHECAEAGGNDRTGPAKPEPWTAVGPRQFAVRDDIAEVGRNLHPESDREPHRINVVQLVDHGSETGGPRDPDGRTERERAAHPHEECVLGRVPLEVRRRFEDMSQPHATRIGRSARSATLTWVTTAATGDSCADLARPETSRSRCKRRRR